MYWRRVDPVQQVGGLLLTGADACAAALSDLSRRSTLFSGLEAVVGRDWIVLVPAAAINTRAAINDLSLPRLEQARALYPRFDDVWLPVGWEAGVPAHAERALVHAMLTRESITGGAVIAPSADAAQSTRAADVYALSGRVQVGEIRGAGLSEAVRS